MAKFTCEVCGYSKSAPDDWVYRKAICPKCKGRSVIVPDEIELADEDDFDPTQTFDYKGDYLGMPLDLFLRRHDDVGSTEFSIISSKQAAPEDYDQYGFEEWIRGTNRIVAYCAYGSRLTIVDVPLKHGVFTFLDGRLDRIRLTVANPSVQTITKLVPALYLALTDPTKVTGVGGITVTTWIRPLGEMSLMHSEHDRTVQVGYVNCETRDTFNAVRARLISSRDL